MADFRVFALPVLCAIAGETACTGAAARSDPGVAGAAVSSTETQAGVLLVANQRSASASIVDLATGTVTSIDVGEGPHEAAISADGRWGVVTIYGASTPGNQLAVVDMSRRAIVRMIDLGNYRRPHDLTFLPGSTTRVAVTSEASQRVIEVDLPSGTVVGEVDTRANGSHMLALAADGRTMFTANMGGSSASQLDFAGRTFVRLVPMPPRPEGIAITPDGREVWVGSNDSGTVAVVETATGNIAATIRDLGMPYRITMSPDGSRAAIPDPPRKRVLVLDVGGRRVLGDILPPGEPRGVDIGPDNRTAFVTLGPEGMVVVVDLDDRSVLSRHTVGASPDGVGWGPAVR